MNAQRNSGYGKLKSSKGSVWGRETGRSKGGQSPGESHELAEVIRRQKPPKQIKCLLRNSSCLL